ncbi:MAG: 6-bladed beta-propeller, partial [Bacteroidales bacterium]
MKKFCIYTSILITFWMLLGCTMNEYKKEIFQLDFSEALKPDKEIKFLSSIASGIDFVPLETKQESLIGRIYNILKIPGGYLIQDSQKQLLFFFNDGTYGWKIESKGVGPNEFNSLTSFDYNYSKQEVLIQSRNDLFCYDLDGNLLRTIKIEKRLNNIKCLQNGNIIGISTNPETTDILTISPEGD